MADGQHEDADVPDVAAFTAWLDERPPYELVGRIVCEAAALEIGLVQCAVQAGADPAALGKMRTRQVVGLLRKQDHPDGPLGAVALDRVLELLYRRDVLAHSAPMNVWGRQAHGFVKLDRPRNDRYLWHGFGTDELTALADELERLAEIVQALRLQQDDRA